MSSSPTSKISPGEISLLAYCLNPLPPRFFNSLPASNAKRFKYGTDPPYLTSESDLDNTDDNDSENPVDPTWRSFKSPRATTMYESIQGYHSGASSSASRKNLSPFDPSSSRANVGDADKSGSVLTEQKMSDHVSAMELSLMASYEEAMRANAIEDSTAKVGEMESGSERGSGTIVAKQSSAAGPFSSTIFQQSSPQSPRGGKWVDVPQCPAVESCLVLSKLPHASQEDSPSSVETQSTKPSEKTDLGQSGSGGKGEKSKHAGKGEKEKEAHNFLRPSSTAPGGSKKPAGSNKSSKKKAGTARPNPFWNEQVDWTPGLAFKYTLPQTDLIEVPTS